ncbi:hypothetical protein E2I00_002216 [Balaenoptera physalus]|uniref:Uncharacterized protein n=1 Tax=Balaenoptera physalus TaxID=9770 RepID=A0A643C0E4_BALPH|nr:hypothetical protein E2I00_002216 [Balaenoptera physalus]
MLDKLTSGLALCLSTSAPRLRERLPLKIFLRNRLKYALTGDKITEFCMHPLGFTTMFDIGNLGLATGGTDLGRTDVITNREISWPFGCG